MNETAFIQLDPADNILVCIRTVQAGDEIMIDGTPVVLPQPVDLGHKIARIDLSAGDQVLRYGVPIGTMILPASRGVHVHSHNLKSDYIPAHHRDATGSQETQ